MMLPKYAQFGGAHNEFAAVKNALAYQNVVDEESGQALSETLLFGIGAGVGASYFSFKYEGHAPTLSLNLVGRYRAGYGEMMKRTLERLGLQISFRQTSSINAALGHLKRALKNGRPVIIQLMAPLAHRKLQVYEQFAEEAWVVYGVDEKAGRVHIAEVSPQGIELELEEVLDAWSAFRQLKHLGITVVPAPVELGPTIKEGIRQCASTLLDPPTPKGNFGLNALSKWATLLVDKRARGWAQLFHVPAELFHGLASVFAQIELLGNGGGMRHTYADFLQQSAGILGEPALATVATHYRDCGSLWTELAETALPDEVEPLARGKALMRRKRSLYLEQGTRAIRELTAINDEQTALAREMANAFPLNPAGIEGLMARMREKLLQVIEAETEAAGALKAEADRLV